MHFYRNHPPAIAAFQFGLVTDRFYETWDFYTEQLGFRTMAQTDETVLLVHASGARLGLLRHETDEVHPERVSATDGRGLWLSLEVADVDAECERLSAAGLPVVRTSDAHGPDAKSFTVRDPNGVLIFITRKAALGFAEGMELSFVENTVA